MSKNHFTLKEVKSLSTIQQGQYADLKYASLYVRIWLSRLTVEDGEPYNNKITIEYFIDGKWIERDTYEAK